MQTWSLAISPTGNNLALSSSVLAHPNIARFRVFSGLICLQSVHCSGAYAALRRWAHSYRRPIVLNVRFLDSLAARSTAALGREEPLGGRGGFLSVCF